MIFETSGEESDFGVICRSTEAVVIGPVTMERRKGLAKGRILSINCLNRGS